MLSLKKDIIFLCKSKYSQKAISKRQNTKENSNFVHKFKGVTDKLHFHTQNEKQYADPILKRLILKCIVLH